MIKIKMSKMNILNLLFHSKDNVKEISYQLSNLLNLKLTATTLCERLQAHPYYPSLLAVHDVFEEFGIDSEGYKLDSVDSLLDVGQPFLAQVYKNEEDKLFALVYNIRTSELDWFNPFKHKRETISVDSFKNLFSGYVLFFETSNESGDKDYKVHRKQEIYRNIIESSLLFPIPILLVILMVYDLLTTYSWNFAPLIYSLLLLIGCGIGGLLLIHEYNAYNPLVKSFCGNSKKLNCDAVLSSERSMFMGIPWSVIGCAYFLGMISSMLVSTFNDNVFITIAYLNLLALPYIVFSIYYQKKVVKQWCPLCLGVLTIILSLFLTALISGVYRYPELINMKSVYIIVICLYLSAILVFVLWKYSIELQKRVYTDSSFKQVKYNTDVFNTLLKKGRKINISTDGYGITVGNPKGSIHIIKVCNPYCSHCAEAQSSLKELVAANTDIRLQMIFTTNPKDPYYNLYPIDTFLSLYHEGKNIEDILIDWYENKSKNIEDFKQKHPVKKRDSIWNNNNANAMSHFCKTINITETPTIFINGFELPNTYSVSDVKYFINFLKL